VEGAPGLIAVRPRPMNLYPTNLTRIDDQHIQIDWSDGQVRRYTVKQLRDACPCATCREGRTERAPEGNPLQLTVLSPMEARPLRVQAMKPVGHYAYNIVFSDGHDSGIFTFELLRELGELQSTLPR
jgi:DUF971 family protein